MDNIFLHITVSGDASSGNKLIMMGINILILLPLQLVAVGWLLGTGLKLAGL